MEKKQIEQMTASVLNSLLKIHPGFADLQNLNGIRLLIQGKFDDSKKHFTNALRINPDYIEPFLNKETLKFLSGEKSKLKPSEIADRILDSKKSIPLETYQIAVILLLLMEALQPAKKLMTQLPSSLQTSPVLLMLKGIRKALMGNPKKSKILLNEASKNSPFLKDRLNKSSFFKNPDKSEGLFSFLKGICLEYYQTQLLCSIAEYHALNQDIELAVFFLEKAQESYPDSYHYQMIHADMAISQGNKEKAKQLLMGANSTDPYRAHPAIRLSFIYGEKGDLKKALSVLNKSIQFNPYYPDLHQYISEIYTVLGKYNQSLKHLKNALLLNSNYTVALFDIADLYERQKKYDESLLNYLHAFAFSETQPDYMIEKLKNIYKKSSFYGKKRIRDVILKYKLVSDEKKLGNLLKKFKQM